MANTIGAYNADGVNDIGAYEKAALGAFLGHLSTVLQHNDTSLQHNAASKTHNESSLTHNR
jgi:hypothetical protein